MALSNIFREPRREITESVVGLAVATAFIWGDYEFALWFRDATAGSMSAKDPSCPWPIGMLIGVGAALAVAGLVIGTHALGDSICDRLEERGIHLRPRNRR